MKPECDWEYIPDTGGMSEVPGGTFDASYYQCATCGAETVNTSDECLDPESEDEE